MTYQEAYNKIIDAYFKDEIRPFSSEFCFCGTLHGSGDWNDEGEQEVGPYSYDQYKEMEMALFGGDCFNLKSFCYTHLYEKYLFAGMSAALDVLKEIHIERGEVIDEVPEFKKRSITEQVKEIIEN